MINVISDKTEPAPVSRDQLYSRGERGYLDDNENAEDSLSYQINRRRL